MKLIFCLLLLTITSCTFTKRLHQPGYHVEWNKKPSGAYIVQDSEKTTFKKQKLGPNKMADEKVDLPIDEQEYISSDLEVDLNPSDLPTEFALFVNKKTKVRMNKIELIPQIKTLVKHQTSKPIDEEKKAARKHKTKSIIFLILSVIFGVLLLVNISIGFVYYLYLLVNIILIVLVFMFLFSMAKNFRKSKELSNNGQ